MPSKVSITDATKNFIFIANTYIDKQIVGKCFTQMTPNDILKLFRIFIKIL